MLNLNATQNNNEVIVTDVRMPFWSLVKFLVKLAFAAIPAIIIINIVTALIIGAMIALVSAMGLGLAALSNAQQPAKATPAPLAQPTPKITSTPRPTPTTEPTPSQDATPEPAP